ncbi:MAG TPA: hypothetical protein VN106_01135, partial [Sphingomicrobium sp.]|nr:hypothetical protein [Sphingomicrobium sp.]
MFGLQVRTAQEAHQVAEIDLEWTSASRCDGDSAERARDIRRRKGTAGKREILVKRLDGRAGPIRPEAENAQACADIDIFQRELAGLELGGLRRSLGPDFLGPGRAADGKGLGDAVADVLEIDVAI